MSDINQSQPESPDVKPKIGLNVIFQGRSIRFQTKRSASLRKVLDVAAQRFNMERATLRFTYDGETVHGREDETPESLGMQEGDEIDAHMQQEGGYREKQFVPDSVQRGLYDC